MTGTSAYPALCIITFAIFLATSFRAGWNRSETDFPNYYTAAVLLAKHAPLHNFYQWTWFQQQMNYAGVENQLGGYIPQTPLTMLPMLAVARLEVQTAKRIWLLLNLAFLGASFWLITRFTSFTTAQVSLLAFAGYGTIHINFLLGQYYVFILFLLVLGFYLLNREKEHLSGLLLGVAFALKLYGGPFMLYFAVKRRWAAMTGLILALVGAAAVATMIFGWADIVYFAKQILPRGLEGETLDPYNAGNGTISTLLRRALVMEPELNPQPLWNAPEVFFFLQPFLTACIIVFPLILLRASGAEKHDFAWFYVALILASPNTASYTFLLLLLPVALLLDEAKPVERVALISCYALVTLPMRPGWNWLFPKVWLLLILFLLASRRYWPLVRPPQIAMALALAAAMAIPVGWRRLTMYAQEPGRRWERITMQPGAIYSSSPAVLRSGIVYESIGQMHYVLRWLHGGRNEEFAFAGDAFHPIAQSPDGPVRFELVAHGKSETMLFDLLTRHLSRGSALAPGEKQLSAVSPDGQWIISTTSAGKPQQIWLQRTTGDSRILLAGGDCNNFSPAWELDSKGVVFASDCGRGIGLPALYRAQLDKLFKR